MRALGCSKISLTRSKIDVILYRCVRGGVAEWLKAAVLKTVECQSSVGSNPTSSAIDSSINFTPNGEMAEPAEGARLLSECGGNTPPRVRIPLSPPFLILG